MKIVKVDNFNRDYINEQEIASNVHEYYAEGIAEDLNKRFSSDNSPDYFRACPNDYKPYEFQP